MIVCLGDSLTEGYMIDRTVRWTKLLSTNLHLTIINSGISGDTTAGMLARFKSDVIDHKPRILVLMGGTNDLYFDLQDNYILSNIKAMVRQARYSNVQVVIGLPTLIYSISNPDTGLFISEQNLLKRIVSYRKALLEFAESDGCIVVDFAAGLERQHFLPDGVHPNESGQKIMAINIAAKLIPLIESL